MCPGLELDGLDADVQLDGGFPVGPAGGDQPGHRQLGRGQAGHGLCSRGRAGGGQLPVADLHVGPGVQAGQALPGRAQPGGGRLRLASAAQPAGVGYLQLAFSPSGRSNPITAGMLYHGDRRRPP